MANEPLTDDYLAQIQAATVAARPGEWPVYQDADGFPTGFGPFSFVDPFLDRELVANVEFCVAARPAVPALLGEIARLRAERHQTNESLSRTAESLRTMQDRVHELETGPALAWAARLDADDLEGFLGDIATAADGDNDLATLAAVEKQIANWRAVAPTGADTPGGVL